MKSTNKFVEKSYVVLNFVSDYFNKELSELTIILITRIKQVAFLE